MVFSSLLRTSVPASLLNDVQCIGLLRAHDVENMLVAMRINPPQDTSLSRINVRGERRPDGRVNLLAYAVGCNPDTDPFDDWWDLARVELGGDDFGEFFDPKEGVFARILDGTDDLMLSATATHLSLEVVPSA